MEYVVQALKVLRNLVHAEANARCPKTVFLFDNLTKFEHWKTGLKQFFRKGFLMTVCSHTSCITGGEAG